MNDVAQIALVDSQTPREVPLGLAELQKPDFDPQVQRVEILPTGSIAYLS